MNDQSSLKEIKGIGDKTNKLFEKIGVYSCADILLHFPRRFLDYPEIIPSIKAEEGKKCAFSVRIAGRPFLKKYGHKSIVSVKAFDESGNIDAIWFNSEYIVSVLKTGAYFIFYGEAVAKGDGIHMEQPEIYSPAEYRMLRTSLRPVYDLTKGLTNKAVTKTVRTVLDQGAIPVSSLPKELEEKYQFPDYLTAFEKMHFPKTVADYDDARKRFVYEEFFLFLLGMKLQKVDTESLPNVNRISNRTAEEVIRDSLPYHLTQAQDKTLNEIYEDVSGPHQMQRLIQGDVGSGKTIVAFISMCWFAKQGMQSVLMAPTEVLAEQHYQSLCALIESSGLNFPIYLLTGSTTAAEKKKIKKSIQTTPGAMVIGTHALIQDTVIYHNLGLVVTDEQHRFGVRQREILSDKGNHPHVLVMSATPIPRTLAIILYGDLSISVMNELPAKRLPIKNCVVGKNWRPNAYRHIEKEVALGHQAYVICPMVDESENSESENVIDYSKKLKEMWGDTIRVSYLHGRMKSSEKEKIMRDFGNHLIDVLVSTTVIEVGIDVPNATVIMIENADRFGLAQLHQLRGRVGRGSAQSYCIFLNTSDTKEAEERLKVLNSTNDGFEIASKDLKLRGPGDYFGIRQSGDLNFRLADIYQDEKLLKAASQDVDEILNQDPHLESEKYSKLKQIISSRMQSMNL